MMTPTYPQPTGPFDGVWRCEDCGAVRDLEPRWRWNGKQWEHHHGYPIGHVPAQYFGPFVEEAEPC